jgi:hypothetical protein
VGAGGGIDMSSLLILVGAIGSMIEGSGIDLTGDFGGSTTSGVDLTSDFSDAIEFCAVDLADLADDLGGGLIASVMLDDFEDLFAGSSEILAGDFWAKRGASAKVMTSKCFRDQRQTKRAGRQKT